MVWSKFLDSTIPLHLSLITTNTANQHLLECLRKSPSERIPDLLNDAFHAVDHDLTKMSEQSEGKMHSGCTAVTAFLRLEDSSGRQSFLPPGYNALESSQELIREEGTVGSAGESNDRSKSSPPDGKHSTASKLKNAIRSIGTSSHARHNSQGTISSTPSPKDRRSQHIWAPPPGLNVRRVLYCANAGDARGVLCRAGKAVRLTYDHKGTDKQEAKRIMDAGGFVMSGRVNGVLAVTRALGDSSMKEFVVGAPYTTETDLSEEDEFLILACDGVSQLCVI